MSFWDFLMKVGARGAVSVALFILVFAMLLMLDQNPALEKNELFSNLAVLVVGSGGLLLVIGFYFGSSVGSSKKDDTIADLAKTGNQDPKE